MTDSRLTLAVLRTERGWAGHFICASRCLFRRNTLLECGEVRIVVSTVGNYVRLSCDGKDDKRHEIGYQRYAETMAWHAHYDGTYWDMDVSREVQFSSPWALGKDADDNEINQMHEVVVAEITQSLLDGESFEVTNAE